MRTPSPAVRYAITILGTVLLGFAGGLFTSGALEPWYAQLDKPFFNPPDRVFAPVWTILYILMGLAAGLVWNSSAPPVPKQRALLLYGVQLALNLLWSLLFFGLKDPVFALVEIIVLTGTIVWCMVLFRQADARAAILLVPYLLWVCFAVVLNASIVALN